MDTIVALLFAGAVLQTTLIVARDECQDDADVLLQTKARVIPEMDVALPKCILHVGPHKTGTTSLQSMLVKNAEMLQQDRWFQPPDLPGRPPGEKNLASLAFFLQQETPNTTEPVWQAFMSWVQEKARNKENIVLASEEFDRDSLNISLLASVLIPFNTTVVINYRHFLEWVPSFYKEVSWSNATDVDTMAQWLSPETATTLGSRFKMVTGGLLFTDALMEAYAQHFDDIRVLELNATFINTFVCSFLKASQLCAYVSNMPDERENERPSDKVDACVSQGGCLDPDVRSVLLNRTISIATEVVMRSHLSLNVDKADLTKKLEALGLCFCDAPGHPTGS